MLTSFFYRITKANSEKARCSLNVPDCTQPEKGPTTGDPGRGGHRAQARPCSRTSGLDGTAGRIDISATIFRAERRTPAPVHHPADGRYGGHRDGALQVFDGPDTLSLAAIGLHEHDRFAHLYDFTSWWLHDVRAERRTCNQRSRPLPRCVAGAGHCPLEDTSGPEKFVASTNFSSGLRLYAEARLT
ncbi:plasmid pRiA4b ORF-3 family protein [Paraburkholderia panacisoli]|uniref:Plasmid pRiA4b ORF-3 family protein n=1 Tax=Paraburkholderia panacisoli TaxID=2603818 RepID=A0A5B0GAP9_9BURK|nr:plasmid pRiA4b ORF-3 family protein [Paraburkholderia panacisoli]